MPIEVRNEIDFNAVVESALAGDVDLVEEGIVFVDWPRYEITIRGEDFNGGVPTRVMPAFMEIQRALNRAYARAIYGDETKRLSKEERANTELVVRLERGSTTFKAELSQALNALVNNMSGTESLIAVLGVAIVVGGVLSLKAFLLYRASVKQSEVQIRMTSEETKRQEQLSRLVEQSMDLARGQQDIEAAQRKLMSSLHDDDQLVLDEDSKVNGYDARRLARDPRRARVHSRMDGSFLIQTLDSGQIPSGYRARVKNIETEQVLTVNIPETVLPPSQVEELQAGEWSKTPLVMSINVQRIGDRIVSADLAEAGHGRPN